MTETCEDAVVRRGKGADNLWRDCPGCREKDVRNQWRTASRSELKWEMADAEPVGPAPGTGRSARRRALEVEGCRRLALGLRECPSARQPLALRQICKTNGVSISLVDAINPMTMALMTEQAVGRRR